MPPLKEKNRDAHIDYIKYTQEQADILRGTVKQAKAIQHLDNALDFACKYAKRIHELLVYVRDTCLTANKPSEKLVVVTPMNKVKKVRFLEPLTSSSNVNKQVESSKTPDSNTLVLPSTGLKSSTSASRSLPTGKKNDRITQTPSNNMKNKIEVQVRRANLSSNKRNRVNDPICDANVKHNMLNVNFELICVKCKQCMFDANYDVCFLDFVNDVNVRSKFKSAKQSKIIIFRNLQMFHLLLILSMTGCLDCSSVSGLWMLKTYDKKPLLAHELRSRDTNLYIISLDDMLKTSLICLLSKASNTKSWLWHRRLSHLNFGTLNKLAKDGLARGIPKLKFKKDHLCSACALGKSKKSSHQPKAKDTNQEKLYLLHMDICGPMRVESINRKIRNVRTDNGTEFVNQTLREFYENVGISHQTSVARTPQ
ncbi:retrovirus-related pol polyprotein from transposon TNT 1-94 [Tanacetum coccineum]